MEDKKICYLCGNYENPTNDEESRLDHPENPEHFISYMNGPDVHDSCEENR